MSELCEFGHTDCTNEAQCHLCFNSSKYVQAKKKTQGIRKNFNKKSNRMGSELEMKSQAKTQATLDNIVSSRLTVNSGAGNEKGDGWILGLVNAMIECKTQEIERAKGHKSFTIKREWLDKLEREAKDALMEFWWLTFSFKDNDDKLYTIIDTQLMNDMLATLVHDRKISKEADSKVDLANKLKRISDTKNTELEATIDNLKARIDYLQALLKKNKIDI